jgi:hypothetical protein
MSLQSIVEWQTRRRSSQTIAPGGGVGSRGAQIAVKRCIAKTTTIRELQLKGANQRRQELLDTEVDYATLLEASNKQPDWES